MEERVGDAGDADINAVFSANCLMSRCQIVRASTHQRCLFALRWSDRLISRWQMANARINTRGRESSVELMSINSPSCISFAACMMHVTEPSCFNNRCFPVSLKPAFCKVRIGKVEGHPPVYLLAWCLLDFPWTPSASLSVGESSKWGDEIVMAAWKRESDSRWCYIPSFKCQSSSGDI